MKLQRRLRNWLWIRPKIDGVGELFKLRFFGGFLYLFSPPFFFDYRYKD